VSDTAELKEMAKGVGIAEDKNVEIITYSNRGTQATMGYFVLHDLLGYKNVKLFDGSILEAAADKVCLWKRTAGGTRRRCSRFQEAARPVTEQT
jgi:3-mercaptopyruvate sulfurtransferase SseA